MGGARRRRQLLDHHVLGLHGGHPARMELDADAPVLRHAGLLLDVVLGLHAVDPGADAGTLGADAVLVPVALPDRGLERGRVEHVRDDAVAPALVVELAVPARTVVALVAGHLRAAGHADAADLDSAVHESGAVQPDLQRELEVLVGLLGGQEEVARHLLAVAAAADLARFDAPPGDVPLPAGEAAAVEDGDRGGGTDGGEQRRHETEQGHGEHRGRRADGLNLGLPSPAQPRHRQTHIPPSSTLASAHGTPRLEPCRKSRSSGTARHR